MDRSTARCWQLLAAVGLFCKLRGQDITMRELHVCYNTGQEILLNCKSSHVILVESAVIGTNEGWTAGTINCPRNNEICVKQIQQPHEECNYKSSCSLPQTIIIQDIENECSATNFINIIYVCLPAENTTTLDIPSTIEETTLPPTLVASTSQAAAITTQSTTVTDVSTQFEISSAGGSTDKKSLKIGLSVFAVILVAVGVAVGVVFYKRRLEKEQPLHENQEHITTSSAENPQPSGEELASDTLTEEDISLGDYLHTCLEASGENKTARDPSDKTYSYDYVDVQLHQKALPLHETPKGCISHNPQSGSNKNSPVVQIHPFQQQDSIKYEDVELKGDTINMQNYVIVYEDTSTQPVSESKYEHLEIPDGDDLDQPTLYESVHLESRASLGWNKKS